MAAVILVDALELPHSAVGVTDRVSLNDGTGPGSGDTPTHGP